jgi:hypothetical protein
VRERLTVCLSALVLLFNAAFTVPSARITPNGVSSRVVYSWQRRQRKPEKHQAEELSKSSALARVRTTRTPAAAALDRAAVPTLDSSLFQRPPPAFS